MKKIARFTSFLTVLALLALAAQGQQVYRCGQSYSENLCPGAVPIDTSDARTQAQKQESKKATQRDIQLAAELEETHKKEEALAIAGRTPAASKSMGKSAKSKKSKLRTTPSDEVAQTKAKPHTKKKKNSEFFNAAMPPVKKKAKKEAAQPAQ